MISFLRRRTIKSFSKIRDNSTVVTTVALRLIMAISYHTFAPIEFSRDDKMNTLDIDFPFKVHNRFPTDRYAVTNQFAFQVGSAF